MRATNQPGQSEEQTDGPESTETGTTATSRPAPKRKFAIRIGTLEFEKRCTAADAAAILTDAPGAEIRLKIDGHVFGLLSDAG